MQPVRAYRKKCPTARKNTQEVLQKPAQCLPRLSLYRDPAHKWTSKSHFKVNRSVTDQKIKYSIAKYLVPDSMGETRNMFLDLYFLQ